MRLPTKNPVSLKYGATVPNPPYSASNPHAGTDYSYYSNAAKTVVAPYWVAPEKVTFTFVRKTDEGACGKMVDFKSVDGSRTYRACHNAEIYVSTGQTVAEGFRIGKMGSTGAAQGAHLHLVMWVKGVRVDPDATIKKLILAGGKEMITQNGLNVACKFYLGRAPNDAEKTKYIGKMTFDETTASIRASATHKAFVTKFKNAKATVEGIESSTLQ